MKTYAIKYEKELLPLTKAWINSTVLVQAITVFDAINKIVGSGIDPERILEVSFSTLEIVS